MPTALAEWTTERPDVPGFYWWIDQPGEAAEVVHLIEHKGAWAWTIFGQTEEETDRSAPLHYPGSLWWPVRLEPPPVG